MATWRKEYTRYQSFFMNIYRVYKTRRDLKMFLEIILSLFTISFFALVALRPTALTITQLLEDINKKEDTLSRMETKISNLQSAQTAYAAEGARLVLLDQALPDTPTPEVLARQLQGIASQYNATLNSLVLNDVVLVGDSTEQRINSELENLPTGTGEVTFSLNALGSYSNLSAFLNDLENFRRAIKIDHSVINIAEIETGKTLTLTITGRVAYLKQE